MNTWKITLHARALTEGFEKQLELFDAKHYFGGYLKIKRTYFNTLIKVIKMTKKYSTGRAIEHVFNPDDEDWTHNPWILIIAKDNEKFTPFWFLIQRKTDLSGLLIALGPRPFALYNDANSDAKRDIKRTLNYLTAYLNKFSAIILLPNHLHEKKEKNFNQI